METFWYCMYVRMYMRAYIQYQNISILDFIGAKTDGGGSDNWSYRTCKVSVCNVKCAFVACMC